LLGSYIKMAVDMDRQYLFWRKAAS
jgi:hypothetical protein